MFLKTSFSSFMFPVWKVPFEEKPTWNFLCEDIKLAYFQVNLKRCHLLTLFSTCIILMVCKIWLNTETHHQWRNHLLNINFSFLVWNVTSKIPLNNKKKFKNTSRKFTRATYAEFKLNLCSPDVLVLPSSSSGWSFLCLDFWCLGRPFLKMWKIYRLCTQYNFAKITSTINQILTRPKTC